MIPLLDARGRLPLGRHVTDMAELQDRFATDSRRADMFQELVTLLHVTTLAIHPVSALWVGGSYVSDKQEPGDIDVVFVIPARAIARAKSVGGNALRVAGLLMDGDPDHEFPALGVKLLADEGPYVGAMPDASLTQKKWLAHRGYWDQLWQCARGKNDEQHHGDHGYLEVIIDGYGSTGLA